MFKKAARAPHAIRDLMAASALYRRTAFVSAVLVLLAFVLPLWRIVPLAREQPFIPLHYNIYFGIDRFGPWYYVFAPAALGLALLLVNLVFEAVFFRRERVLSSFFAGATVFGEAVLFVSVVLIVLLNL